VTESLEAFQTHTQRIDQRKCDWYQGMPSQAAEKLGVRIRASL